MTNQQAGINIDDVVNQANSLLKSVLSLSTFNDVKEWDEKAAIQIANIVAVVDKTKNELSHLNQQSQMALQEHEDKPFLNRIFSSNPERKFKSAIAELEKQRTILESLAEELQLKIDFTPNSSEEQKILIQELKQRKKELNAEKREVAAKMKEIRTIARQESANASYSVGALVGGSKYTAAQRRAIRYEKESKLAPHEDEKASIERQIIEADKLIIWAERFK